MFLLAFAVVAVSGLEANSGDTTHASAKPEAATSGSTHPRTGARIRIGTSGDYPPFSEWRVAPSEGRSEPSGPASAPVGFDIDLARAYARDRGLEIEWVRFGWPHLMRDLGEDRFDLAMSGITIRADRSIAGRFSVPTASSEAVVLMAPHVAAAASQDLDRPDVRIAVNSGGHLERVARAHFPKASISAIESNAAVRAALATGAADAVLTDSREAPLWRQAMAGVRELGPLTRDFKAILIAPDLADLATDIDRWLLKSEASGHLAALRRKHFGVDLPRTAEPLAALVAAIELRLSLMPYVADAKLRRRLPIEAPEREVRVIESAQQAVVEAARSGGRQAPPARAVQAFFEAQIAAAKEIQRRPSVEDAGATARRATDLEHELRPALLRIGEQIARLIVELPKDLSHRSKDLALAHAAASLGRLGLSSSSVAAITRALDGLLSPAAASDRILEPSTRLPASAGASQSEVGCWLSRLRADPALNHPICSSLSV